MFSKWISHWFFFFFLCNMRASFCTVDYCFLSLKFFTVLLIFSFFLTWFWYTFLCLTFCCVLILSHEMIWHLSRGLTVKFDWLDWFCLFFTRVRCVCINVSYTSHDLFHCSEEKWSGCSSALSRRLFEGSSKQLCSGHRFREKASGRFYLAYRHLRANDLLLSPLRGSSASVTSLLNTFQ